MNSHASSFAYSCIRPQLLNLRNVSLSALDSHALLARIISLENKIQLLQSESLRFYEEEVHEYGLE